MAQSCPIEHIPQKKTLLDRTIIFRNFSGAVGPYNKNGDRTFSILIETEEEALELENEGWYIKALKPDEDGVVNYHLNVKINYQAYHPPRIFMVIPGVSGETTDRKLFLNETSIATLDTAYITSVDVSLNPYAWQNTSGCGIRAYVDTLYAVIKQDELDRKWA